MAPPERYEWQSTGWVRIQRARLKEASIKTGRLRPHSRNKLWETWSLYLRFAGVTCNISLWPAPVNEYGNIEKSCANRVCDLFKFGFPMCAPRSSRRKPMHSLSWRPIVQLPWMTKISWIRSASSVVEARRDLDCCRRPRFCRKAAPRVNRSRRPLRRNQFRHDLSANHHRAVGATLPDRNTNG